MTSAIDRTYTVGQAARLGGVTVRTLHHYERIGLLVPSERSGSGYRLYGPADLDRLTRILYYRELGFGLDDIATLLADAADPTALGAHLDRQDRLLTERLERLSSMVAAIEKERQAMAMGQQLSAEEKLEIFGANYDPSWETEAEQRWGGTHAWQQSTQRAKRRTKADWQRIKDEGDAWNDAVRAAFAAGTPAASDRAAELAEQHRAMVAEHYDCSYAMHRQLADMFVADPRFAKTYEDIAPGLAQWVHDAIHANEDRHPAEQGEGFC